MLFDFIHTTLSLFEPRKHLQITNFLPVQTLGETSDFQTFQTAVACTCHITHSGWGNQEHFGAGFAANEN